MTVRVTYIDDTEQDLARYASKLATDPRSAGRFRVTTLGPPKTPEEYDIIRRSSPDLLLVDHNLDKPDAEDRVIGISGLSLATELRQKLPEIPIVLFTRRSVFRFEDYRGIEAALSIADSVVFKQDVFKTGSRLIDELLTLATGYKALRDSPGRSWSDILRLTGASGADGDLMAQCRPPTTHGVSWSAAPIASWLRDTVIRYPGILYGPVHASTFLGVSKDAFLSEAVQKAFSKAKYAGIFTPTGGRWWRSKLSESAYSMMTRRERNLTFREGFATAWERRNGAPLEAASCIFSGEYPADYVCHVLEQPVMIKYTLLYLADKRPEAMDEARVSFEAIRTSNDFNERFLDSVGRELLHDVRHMAKPDAVLDEN